MYNLFVAYNPYMRPATGLHTSVVRTYVLINVASIAKRERLMQPCARVARACNARRPMIN